MPLWGVCWWWSAWGEVLHSVRTGETGLEKALAMWGVTVVDKLILDEQNDAFPIPVQRDLGNGIIAQDVRRLPYPYFVHVPGTSMSDNIIAIAAMAFVAFVTGEPFVFPSLGPTAFLLFYTPLLPGAAAGTLEPRHVVVPLREELDWADVQLGSVTGLDPALSELRWRTLDGRESSTRYDQLVIALGSVSRTLPVPGLAEYAHVVHTLDEGQRLRRHLDDASRIKRAVVVGAGVRTRRGSVRARTTRSFRPASPVRRPPPVHLELVGAAAGEPAHRLGRAVAILQERALPSGAIGVGQEVDVVGDDVPPGPGLHLPHGGHDLGHARLSQKNPVGHDEDSRATLGHHSWDVLRDPFAHDQLAWSADGLKHVSASPERRRAGHGQPRRRDPRRMKRCEKVACEPAAARAKLEDVAMKVIYDRETDSLLITQRDTPIFTCVQMPMERILDQLF